MQTDQLQNISDPAARQMIESLVHTVIEYHKQLEAMQALTQALSEKINQLTATTPRAVTREKPTNAQ